jgi:hypothetical protein
MDIELKNGDDTLFNELSQLIEQSQRAAMSNANSAVTSCFGRLAKELMTKYCRTNAPNMANK